MKNIISARLVALAALLLSGATSIASPSKIPAELVGSWRWTTVSATNYENETTGVISGGGGMTQAFTFSKNGHYSFHLLVKTRTYNYVSEASASSEGTFSISGNTLQLHPTHGHYLSYYGGRKKTDRDMSAAERRKNTLYYWKWQTQNGKRILMMGLSPTVLADYRRQN